MSPGAAQAVHFAVLGVAVLVWLFALRAHRRAFAGPSGTAGQAEGDVEVDAPLDVTRTRLVEALRGGGMVGGLGGGGPVEIEEAGERRIAGVVAPVHRGRAVSAGRSRFEIDLAPLGGRTAATWRVRPEGGGGLRAAGAVFVYLLTPAALGAALVVMNTLVIPSAEPAVRWQVLQTAQVVHFLWPPFLFAAVYRRIPRAVGEALRRLLGNCSF